MEDSIQRAQIAENRSNAAFFRRELKMRKNGNFSVLGERRKGGARAARGGAKRPRAPPEAAPEAQRCAGGAYILRDTTGSDFSTQIASSTQTVTHGMRRFLMILSIQDDFLGKKHL